MSDHREGDDDLSGRRRDREQADEPELTTRELLVSLHKKVDVLAGIPGAVRTLQDQYIELTAALEALKPMLEHHGDEVRAHGRILRELKPALDKMQPELERVSIIVPAAVARTEIALRRLDEHDGMLGEIRTQQRESQRAAAGEKT